MKNEFYYLTVQDYKTGEMIEAELTCTKESAIETIANRMYRYILMGKPLQYVYICIELHNFNMLTGSHNITLNKDNKFAYQVERLIKVPESFCDILDLCKEIFLS